METFTQSELELARWLLEREGVQTDPPAAGSQAWGRLAPRLANIFTSSGNTALLSRALYLASARSPQLGAVRDGHGLERLPEALAGVGRLDAVAAVVELWATILHLLVTFIGPGLTVRILSDVWPGATLVSAEPASEEEQP